MPKRASKTAKQALDFLPTLIVPEGRLAGKPLKLATYQRDFVRGALANDISIGVLSIGRGNAKTALASGLALGHLIGKIDPQPKREIIFAARNRDQAKIAFNFVLGFVEGLPPEDQMRFTVRAGSKLEIETDLAGGGIARVIAADGKSILGGAPTLAILDERAAWEPEKGDALESGILSGLGKRDGRALIISTSAPDDANTFSRWLDEPPNGCYVQEHRADPGLPPDDEASLLAANPGSKQGIGPRLDWLKSEAQRAMARGGHALSAFRNLNRNERVAADDRSVLVTTDEWMAAETGDMPERAGKCVLGIDLGGSRSMTAAALFWPDTGRLEALGAFPSNPTLADRGAADGVKTRYVEMADRGELLTLGQETVPIDEFLREIVSRLDGIAPDVICGDRFRQAEFEESLHKAGMTRTPIIYRGQGFKDGSEDVERFRRMLFDGNVETTPSLLLRSAFADAITVIDPAGNHKLTKARSKGRIDAACAAVLAVAEGHRMNSRPEPSPIRVAWG